MAASPCDDFAHHGRSYEMRAREYPSNIGVHVGDSTEFLRLKLIYGQAAGLLAIFSRAFTHIRG